MTSRRRWFNWSKTLLDRPPVWVQVSRRFDLVGADLYGDGAPKVIEKRRQVSIEFLDFRWESNPEVQRSLIITVWDWVLKIRLVQP